MIAARHNGPRNTNPAMAITNGKPIENTDNFAAGTEGRRQLLTDPRSGNRSPSTTIVTMMIRNGKPSRAPYSGHQLTSFWSLVNIDCTMPMSRPVMSVGQNKRKRPMRAAPRAGMRKPNV